MLRGTLLCGLILATSLFSGAAWALPCDRTITFAVHATPTDPNSPVQITIACSLHAVSSSGSTLGWQVTAADVKEYDGEGALLNAWRCSAPTLGSSDGLWWTTHATILYPQPAEFTYMPAMTGTGLGVGGTATSLQLDTGGTGSPYSLCPIMTIMSCFMTRSDGGTVVGGADTPSEQRGTNPVPDSD